MWAVRTGLPGRPPTWSGWGSPQGRLASMDLKRQEQEKSLPFPGCWEIRDEHTATRPAKVKEALGMEAGSLKGGGVCAVCLPHFPKHRPVSLPDAAGIAATGQKFRDRPGYWLSGQGKIRTAQGGCSDTDRRALLPELLTQEVWSEAWECAFPTSAPARWRLLTRGPHFVEHRSRSLAHWPCCETEARG